VSKQAKLVAALAVALGLALALWAVPSLLTGKQPPPGGTASGAGATVVDSQGSSLTTAIAGLQTHLRTEPKDARSWATLGLAYVQQARITADPTYYPKAEGALRRALALDPRSDLAVAVQGSLAAGRHDFAAARTAARHALRINPDSPLAYGVLSDALVELGHYRQAFAAMHRLDDLQPGVSSFSRLSYAAELRGHTDRARSLLTLALQDADTPADAAFARFYSGELAWNSGDLAGAERQYHAGLAADPTYLDLLAGQAKVEAARGESAAAVRDYRAVVEALPKPQYLIELGDLYASLGRATDARRTYDLVRTEERLFRAQGVNIDLELALFDADHGRPGAALRAARTEYGRRHSILVEDAYGWALHVNGRDRQALRHARAALRIGLRSASFHYHKGIIEKALGDRVAARSDLAAALRINPHFSTVQAPRARQALQDLSR